MRVENFRWTEVEAWVVRPHANSRYTAAQQVRDAEQAVMARGMVYSCGPFARVEPMPRGWHQSSEFHWTAYGRAVHHFH